MDIRKITTFFFDTNIYLFTHCGKNFMIDCGGDPNDTAQALLNLNFFPDYVLLTHGHIDHIYSLSILDKNVNVVIHPEDEKYLRLPSFNLSSRLLGKDISFQTKASNGVNLENDFGIQILHTPGHSPGSVCYLVGEHLFSGDTLFNNGIGNTSFPGGDYAKEIESLSKLMNLDENIRVYPGHGMQTTIGAERKMI